MSNLQWGTFVADASGVVDYYRVAKLVSVILALAAGIVFTLIMAGIWEAPDSDVLLIGVGAMILPITGGVTAGSVAAVVTKARAKADA